MRTLSAVLLFGLSACAPEYMWNKAGTSRADFESDRTQCLYEAKKATPGPVGQYRSVFGEDLSMAVRERKLAIMCMEARGYSRVPLSAGAPSHQIYRIEVEDERRQADRLCPDGYARISETPDSTPDGTYWVIRCL